MLDYEKDIIKWYIYMLIATTIFLLAVLLSTSHAGEPEIYETYTIDQIADAIYIAEGGKNTRFPYGIKSIKCQGEKACRRICKNTIRNNIKRYTRNSRGFSTYLEFLGSRYCPTSGKLSKSEKRLNRYWVSNVRRILYDRN